MSVPTEEEILRYYRLLCKKDEVVVIRTVAFGIRRGLLFNARPGEVYIKEEKEDTKSYYGRLSYVNTQVIQLISGSVHRIGHALSLRCYVGDVDRPKCISNQPLSVPSANLLAA